MKKFSGELQYLDDSLLIEQLAILEFGLIKQAGVIDMLGGVAEAIKNQVKQQINTDSAGGIAGGLANLMAPSILFRLHPVVGVLYLIGNSFGLDITSLFAKIMAVLKPKLEKGLPISPEEVNSSGREVVASMVGPIEAAASGYSQDLLSHLRTVDFTQLKTSQDASSVFKALTGLSNNSGRQTIPGNIPWLMGDSNASPIQKIFGNLFASRSTGKAKWLLGGFVIWIIKTILAGAGLLAVGTVVSQYLKPQDKHPNVEPKTVPYAQQTEQTAEVRPAVWQADNSNHTLKPSGRGEQIFPNDDSHLWVVPLVRADITTTLLTWAHDVYPELQDSESRLTHLPSFQKIVSTLQKNYKASSPNSLTMPKPFTNRKQVVDLLLKEWQ